MPSHPHPYRQAAGIAVFNAEGKVFLGRRKGASGPYIWQLPQGGIDAGESPSQAAIRELEEETGITPDLVSSIGEIDEWLYYDFPKTLTNSRMAKQFKGQMQKWFAYRYHGEDNQIDLSAHEQIEFSDWRWEHIDHAVKLIVPFKRNVYERVAKEFAKFENIE